MTRREATISRDIAKCLLPSAADRSVIRYGQLRCAAANGRAASFTTPCWHQRRAGLHYGGIATVTIGPARGAVLRDSASRIRRR